MSVSISASLFDIDQMIVPWKGRDSLGNMLVLGNPLVPKDPDWDVPPLPGAEEEAKALADRLTVPVYIGSAADKARFMADARSADSLYIAAHATSDPREPLTGGFVMLSGPNPDQAFLRAKEVSTMGLKASIAVLSACQTGLGMAHEGGTIGLARSFQKGGVPRVVMSLWSVSDEATVYLMDRFSEHMLTQPPSEALRLAMLDARKRYDDPSLWAPFTLFGTPR
jgi:CHAT domain-containing protein